MLLGRGGIRFVGRSRLEMRTDFGHEQAEILDHLVLRLLGEVVDERDVLSRNGGGSSTTFAA